MFKKIIYCLAFSLFSVSCAENNNFPQSIEGDKNIEQPKEVEPQKKALTTDTFLLNDNVSLKITLPNFDCPQDIPKNNLCFHSADNNKKSLMLDPGHELSLASARNGRHDEIHEGYLNMVVATLVKHYIKKCFAYNPRKETGIRDKNVFLSYYPGEKHYGEFLLDAKPNSENKIIAQSSNRRLQHINNVFSEVGQTSRSVVISIHADAPDYANVDNRKAEFPYVMYRKVRPQSKSLAKNVYKSMAVSYTHLTLPTICSV